MKNKIIVSALIAATLCTGNLAFAQDNGRRNDQHEQQRGDDRGGNDRRNDHDDRDHRDNRDDHRGPQGRPDFRGDERGAGPDHAFRRGNRLPPQYRERQYVVDDWRGHRLSAPPRGYHWVQTGGDYVLVAIGTGIIMQLLLGH
ncbi:RcnB family protein [Herbaspirillum sp. RTI4]|uniref:RcnB family protein n=1 Tax=Herbaspirillum sp. RTI4 TaxID=3048640 RepID=UPI002AB33B20|nr:RcnB family protein [Herbaspirillum sp. RTI4]MDY7578210.1 RcnB family protein [Herbaspirillum sp. RTI4]MEA9981548.1 RcnB family protein [Herbaspirillum sp. RTI4]